MTVEKILGQCAIGVAPYKPDEHNFSATTDSAKLKSYASSGLPIVMTGVPVNSIELQTSQVASICKYDVQDLASTTMTILNNQETWSRMNSAAIEYIAKYDWNHIFAKVMSNLGYVDVE
jgi:glycosyltransferase involved in cell wall biosynthesis